MFEMNSEMAPFLLGSSCIKFFYLLRNPIDLVYAAWHYWCIPSLDRDCRRGGWVASLGAKAFPRTPENFHSILLSHCIPTADEIKEDLLTPIHQKKGFSAQGCPLRWPWSAWSEAEKYLQQLSRDRLMIIQTEELAEHPKMVMKSVYQFLDLPQGKINSDAYNRQQKFIFTKITLTPSI